MKHFITFILTVMTIQFARSQEYKPFDFDNGEWYCRYVTKGGMFGGGHGIYYATDTVKFFCSGDTIINDTLYKKLFYEGYTSSQFVPRTYISGYYGAIRNDTLNKRVWLHDSFYTFTGSSYIIYDFNVFAEDSICNDVIYPLPITFYFCGIVESIDLVNYCDKYFKKYIIEDNQSIIEGIGSDKGLLPVKSDNWFSELLCYNERNSMDCESCDINTSNVINLISNESFVCFNQSDNNIYISSDYKIESIELIDLYGRYVIKNYILNSNSFDLCVNQKGVFILRVKFEKGIINKKIVIN